ncbi:GlxA family transcriptional regulator [Taibaiella chishuiensis]|uniref:AraC family transcriptional regulator with amidase-like domain n=1 Tax=Taibaiella chishuiensis TaxID=1434707 RepID=A0A2P8D0L2_9BACT|nr:helix-turn-helix domain-containing protein [Taibaiella chishuiensis]PSK90759.1 AraC family transcriptional regulator with amidase-like domain [Taibaiella chishuiensis]
MKHLTILVPDVQTANSTIACIVGAYQVFTGANDYRVRQGKRPLFKIETAGVAPEAAFINGLLTIRPQVDLASLDKTDLVLVPSLNPAFEQAVKGNIQLVDWLTRQYKNGAEIASMCTGAFMVAATGLLAKRNCSIHWNAADHFRSLYPEVHLKTEQVITDEQGIYTNGGGYSFLNLLLYLVEKYYDRETAIYCSKIFQIDIDRQVQSSFTIFTGQKTHGDELVKEAQLYLEANFRDKVSVAALSKRFSAGRRNFDRRFVKATGNTPLEYLQRVKIESAKKALETTRKTIQEVMYEVGYADVKAFREVFRKITGLSPLDYKNKYNKEAAGKV